MKPEKQKDLDQYVREYQKAYSELPSVNQRQAFVAMTKKNRQIALAYIIHCGARLAS